MTTAYLSAIAALVGSVIGGLTSLATAWVTQNGQAVTQELAREKLRRQKLYRQFIEEASRLYAHALSRNQADVSDLVDIHALVSRMRVLSSSAIVEKAEEVVKLVVDTYVSPNKTFPELRDMVNNHGFILLRDFSEACRDEYFGFLGRASSSFARNAGSVKSATLRVD
jgi:ribosomal protein S17